MKSDINVNSNGDMIKGKRKGKSWRKCNRKLQN